MELGLDMLVRITSAIALIAILVQLFNTSGSTFHVRVGAASAVNVAFLLGAVLVRGVLKRNEPHGPIYDVHLVLGTLFFVSYAFAVYFGVRAREEVMQIRHHKMFARSAAVLIFLSLFAGIWSAMSNK